MMAYGSELHDYGVLVNAATPGTTATAIFGIIGVPKGAQSPEISAIRILTGAARDDRIIPGDDSDLASMFVAHNLGAAVFCDHIFHTLAASRKDGATSDFVTGIY